ncbi:hypothetical protein [Pseudokineococcus lusitanus]|uniref:Uncharacterized protein n=1 Tax=Pseudokineococcus lusitanus TaxID=763993 RepID=A0A3N1HU42_9ACTN|nr:hypothetical protein [Pseudokineococcus lusitanus]ROP45947.1 hypothetical protein EDC03_0563 [Pseudokineococcus lusitanus]
MTATTVPGAVLDQLRVLVTKPVYDGHVPKDTKGQPRDDEYVVLWASPGVRRSDDLAGQLLEQDTRFQVSCVGVSAAQARWLAQRCRDGLLTWWPEVTGMRLDRPEHESSSPTRRDDDLPSPLFLAADTYVVRGFRTSP